MAIRRREKGRRKLLPGSVESGLRRLVLGTYGLAIVAAACAAWASLASWSVHDPSLNNATRATPRNLLGAWGAVVADLAIQSLGLAAIFLFLPLAAWGWHLVFRTRPDPRPRPPVRLARRRAPARRRARRRCRSRGAGRCPTGLAASSAISSWPAPMSSGRCCRRPRCPSWPASPSSSSAPCSCCSPAARACRRSSRYGPRRKGASPANGPMPRSAPPCISPCIRAPN